MNDKDWYEFQRLIKEATKQQQEMSQRIIDAVNKARETTIEIRAILDRIIEKTEKLKEPT